MSMTTIAVKHNIEVAHRLFELPGKCEQIHGHSMWVTMELQGRLNDKGILGGIEYGALKKVFRGHLDETYDHRLLLNVADPYARPIYMFDVDDFEPGERVNVDEGSKQYLPGLQATMGDPTTENLAKWIAHDMYEEMVANDLITAMPRNIYSIDVTVWETSVNMARFQFSPTKEVDK